MKQIRHVYDRHWKYMILQLEMHMKYTILHTLTFHMYILYIYIERERQIDRERQREKRITNKSNM